MERFIRTKQKYLNQVAASQLNFTNIETKLFVTFQSNRSTLAHTAEILLQVSKLDQN